MDPLLQFMVTYSFRNGYIPVGQIGEWDEPALIFVPDQGLFFKSDSSSPLLKAEILDFINDPDFRLNDEHEAEASRILGAYKRVFGTYDIRETLSDDKEISIGKLDKYDGSEEHYQTLAYLPSFGKFVESEFLCEYIDGYRIEDFICNNAVISKEDALGLINDPDFELNDEHMAEVTGIIEALKSEMAGSRDKTARLDSPEAVNAEGSVGTREKTTPEKTGIEFTFESHGRPIQVELVRRAYRDDSLAISALLSDPADEEFGEPWGTITVNLSSPLQKGATVLLDTNNMSRELLAKVERLGTRTGQSVASGFCTYPAFTFAESVMDNMRTPGEFSAAVHRTLEQEMDIQDDAPDRNSVFAVVPAKIGRASESVRYFEATGRDGGTRNLAEVTLPHGTMVGGMDASFYRFVVSANQIDAGGRDGSRSHSILLPERNRTTGEPWRITLTRDFGGRDANGVWQPDKRTITATSTELRDCLKAQYQAYRERAQQRQADRPQHQHPERGYRAQRAPEPPRSDEGGCDLDFEGRYARETSAGLDRGRDCRQPGREGRDL